MHNGEDGCMDKGGTRVYDFKTNVECRIKCGWLTCVCVCVCVGGGKEKYQEVPEGQNVMNHKLWRIEKERKGRGKSEHTSCRLCACSFAWSPHTMTHTHTHTL